MRNRVLILLLCFIITSFTAIKKPKSRIILKLKNGINLIEKNQIYKIVNQHNGTLKKSKHDGVIGNVVTGIVDVDNLKSKLESNSNIEFLIEDNTIPLDIIKGDPSVKYQWHHQNIETFDSWSVTKGEGVIVGVCDTGVDKEHLELNENLILPGYNVVDDSHDMTPVHPHGTMVSGLIAGVANNGIGGAGIAPKVRILPIKVSNEGDGRAYYSDLAECIMYAVDNGAKVINLSYGGAHTEVINAAGKYARNNGAMLVVAAGNSGMDISGWDDWDSFVLVGATDIKNEIAYFSNYGTPIDITAPGVSVYTTELTTEEDKAPYRSTSGTSFSAPMVAATAAMIYAVNNEFTMDEVQDILYESADGSIGSEFEYGAGLLKVNKSLKNAKERSR